MKRSLWRVQEQIFQQQVRLLDHELLTGESASFTGRRSGVSHIQGYVVKSKSTSGWQMVVGCFTEACLYACVELRLHPQSCVTGTAGPTVTPGSHLYRKMQHLEQ